MKYILKLKIAKFNDFEGVKKKTSYVGKHQSHVHGTHVAGTIAADGRLKGVAPGATLYDYEVCGDGELTSQRVIAGALRRAADDGCHIVNMSLGACSDSIELVLHLFVL